ncbi:hypothetical protein TrVE_jg13837 [Triparma verrucosa]|uniref:SAP domain-containing protein n=1 Tax=Triparma verrucosa TaxID=1606542 RepID=A0A9W7FKH5_9STRA|nr:hypothetical protein TrVE_jg13837 [Triparma verrucosa]
MSRQDFFFVMLLLCFLSKSSKAYLPTIRPHRILRPQARLFSTPDDLTKLTIPELKAMLRSRSLKLSGKKSELIDRLTCTSSSSSSSSAPISISISDSLPNTNSIFINACKS